MSAVADPVEGVDFEIVRAGDEWPAELRVPPTGWTYRCLHCRRKGWGEWSDPDNARAGYRSHTCS